MTTREKIVLTYRGYKVLHSLVPGMILSLSLSEIFSAVLPFVNIFMSAKIITAFSRNESITRLITLAAITALLNAVTMLLSAGFNKLFEYYFEKMSRVYDKPIKDKIQAMDYALVEDVETHLKIERMRILRDSMGYGIPYLVYSGRNILGGIFKTVLSLTFLATAFSSRHTIDAGSWEFIFSPISITVIIALIAVNLFLNSLFTHMTTRFMSNEFKKIEQENRIGGFFIPNLMNYKMGKDMKLYNLDKPIHREFTKCYDKIMSVMESVRKYQVRNVSFLAVINTVITGVIYVYVALKALFGAFGVGSIVQYAGSLLQLNNGIESIVSEISWLDANTRALEMFFEFIDMPNAKHQGTLPVEKRAFCVGGDNDYEIEFKNVSFKYPASELFALKNVSLKFKVGERLAVVGMNGSGKTTLIKLLCRLYDPTEGEILLNGIDIRKYDYEEYMSIFSVVFQDFKLFSFSLGQNIAASVNYDRAAVEKCLIKAGLSDRLEKMPQGLDTCLYKDFDENGVEISGGEAQKIALARALYKDAPFIVLDEPTAALDPISEAEIYAKFNEIVGEKTAIYISHRLSSCRFCDNILVFDKGYVVQTGSHEALVSLSGKYRELWNAQAQYYTDSVPVT